MSPNAQSETEKSNPPQEQSRSTRETILDTTPSITLISPPPTPATPSTSSADSAPFLPEAVAPNSGRRQSLFGRLLGKAGIGSSQSSLTERRRRLGSLHSELAKILIAEEDPRDRLNLSLETLAGHLGISHVRLWNCRPEDDRLLLQASYGAAPMFDEAYSAVRMGEEIVGLCAREGRTLRMEHPQTTPFTDMRRFVACGFSGIVCRPLSDEVRLLGVVAIIDAQPIQNEAVELLEATSGFLANLLELIRNREAIQVRDQSLTEFLVSSRDLIVEVNRERIITALNPTIERLIGGRIRDWLYRPFDSLVHSEDIEAVSDRWNGVLRGETREPLVFRLQGREKPARVEMFFRSQSNGDGAIGVGRDLTGLLGRDSSRPRNDKLETLGRAACGMAHDLNNYLAIIRTSNFVLRTQESIDEAGLRAIDEIEAAVDCGASLCSMVLNCGREQRCRPGLLAVNRKIEELLPLLSRLVGERIEVELKLSHIEGFIEMELCRFQQLILNLCANSRDAMTEGGVLRITTQMIRRAVLDEPLREANIVERVRIVVSDTGAGISSDILPRIFEPHFTSNRPQGNGLGLALVQEILQEVNGTIEVSSRPGFGSTFSLEIPHKVGSQDKQSKDS